MEAARALAASVSHPLTPIAPSQTSWLLSGLLGGRPFRLAEVELELLERYREPFRNYTPEWSAFYRGAYGPAHKSWLPRLCWDALDCETETKTETEAETPLPHFFALRLREPETLAPSRDDNAEQAWIVNGLQSAPAPELMPGAARARPCPRWKAPRRITVLRWAGERETMLFTDCEGALLAEAVERMSVLARPPGVERPELPLPFEPRGEGGEWLPELRLLHPRLLWAVTRIAASFPGRSIVLMSGYRKDGHGSLHGKGQALDLYVSGTANESLFAVCRALRDVGCGFYPNNRFVHIDVRVHGTGRVAWVDTSAPGEASRYVDGWPGALGPGIGWLGGG